MQESISIILVTRNCKETIGHVLNELLQCHRDFRLEVVVIDLCSSDGSLEEISKFSNYLFCRVITKNENLSYATLCNLAATKAKHDTLLFAKSIIVDIALFIKSALEKLSNSQFHAVGLSKTPDCSTRKEDKTASCSPSAIADDIFLCKHEDFNLLGGFCENYNNGLEFSDFAFRLNALLNKKTAFIDIPQRPYDNKNYFLQTSGDQFFSVNWNRFVFDTHKENISRRSSQEAITNTSSQEKCLLSFIFFHQTARLFPDLMLFFQEFPFGNAFEVHCIYGPETDDLAKIKDLATDLHQKHLTKCLFHQATDLASIIDTTRAKHVLFMKDSKFQSDLLAKSLRAILDQSTGMVYLKSSADIAGYLFHKDDFLLCRDYLYPHSDDIELQLLDLNLQFILQLGKGCQEIQ